jgi:16S rRNA C967 or C1407 C5-methylase (RsmB/RsmF family)
LTNASKLVKQGERIYYSTCSLEREENEGVIIDFLGHNSGFQMEMIGLRSNFHTGEGFFADVSASG